MNTRYTIILAVIFLMLGIAIGGMWNHRPASALPLPAAPSPNASTAVDYCTAPPIVSEIGSADYPINPKYRPLGYLGQLFTAADCGPERVKNIMGVVDGKYTLGSTIRLREAGGFIFSQGLGDVGFRCVGPILAHDDWGDDCRVWRLPDSVELDVLLDLRQFFPDYGKKIEDEDCVNCG